MAFNAQSINPINLNPNIGIGINIPFNNVGPAEALFYTTGSTVTVVNNGVFTSNYNTQEAIKNNLINYFLTNPGELPLNPSFGAGLRAFLFEQITDLNNATVKSFIQNKLDNVFPMIQIASLDILSNTQDNNTIIISLKYFVPNTNIQGTLSFQF